jgi:uncharacterized protein YigA (DUF484 family)
LEVCTFFFSGDFSPCLTVYLPGVAVGTSEIEEENAERLAETQKELEEVRARLFDVTEENSRLKAQLQQY